MRQEPSTQHRQNLSQLHKSPLLSPVNMIRPLPLMQRSLIVIVPAPLRPGVIDVKNALARAIEISRTPRNVIHAINLWRNTPATIFAIIEAHLHHQIRPLHRPPRRRARHRRHQPAQWQSQFVPTGMTTSVPPRRLTVIRQTCQARQMLIFVLSPPRSHVS